MKQSKAFHKGIRRVWSRKSAVSGTSLQVVFVSKHLGTFFNLMQSAKKKFAVHLLFEINI